MLQDYALLNIGVQFNTANMTQKKMIKEKKTDVERQKESEQLYGFGPLLCTYV